MSISRWLCLPILLTAALASAAPRPSYIKFATLAPEGSTWMKVMDELDEELSKETGGRLRFKMYPGGISGDEKDVVKKVRIGQLHAAGFTGVGLGEIAPEVRILDAPWLFRGPEEVDYIHERFGGEFTAAVERAGYIVLGWTDLGFVYVFSKEPIAQPQDMKKARMWVWEGDPIAQAAYKAIGVSPIPLSVVDVLPSLQTGLIDAVYGPPMGVVALQWHSRTKHIYSVPMAESAGAVLMSKRRFSALPKDQQKVLKRLCAKHFARLKNLTRAENSEALSAMRKLGLELSGKPAAETLRLYEELGRKARRDLTGRLYSKDLLDRVEAALEEFRTSARRGEEGNKAPRGGRSRGKNQKG